MANADARVLIIENNDALRVMMFTILRHQPLNVDTAVTADEAIEKIMTCDYALILVDTDLPDDEADEFLRRFREERPQSTSFILAVRDPNKESSIDGRVVSAILNKPIEIDTLADVVRECAIVVPRPPDPLPCPPAESEIRQEIDRGSLPN
jgi:DNA-binding response OmpR family regulator